MKIRSASTPHHVGGDSVEDFGSKQSVSNIFSSTLLNCWTVVSWKRHVWLCFQAKSICWLLISNTEAAEMTNRVICVENRTSACLLSLWPLHFLLLSLVFAQAGDNAIFPPPPPPPPPQIRQMVSAAAFSSPDSLLCTSLSASSLPPLCPLRLTTTVRCQRSHGRKKYHSANRTVCRHGRVRLTEEITSSK